MRWPASRLVLLCLVCGFCSLLYALTQRGSGGTEGQDPVALSSSAVWRGAPGVRHRYNLPERHELDMMHLAVVACGDRLDETVTMLKSALLFSIKPLQFHVFAEDQLHKDFSTILNSWGFSKKFKYTLYPISFPSENAAEWRKLFKPCASQRLFLPLILKDLDSLLYVDTDIIFLRPVDDIWFFLNEFNSTQIAAMAPEHEEPRIGWYNRFARHPFYGKTGINSGVMLMNMTRIRRKHFKNDMTTVPLHWGEILMPLLKKYKLNITWGDQDLLNIIFSHNPESIYIFPCQWNYRPDHCIYGSNCNEAEDGIFILHGNRGVYHDNKQPAFRAVYEALRNFSFGYDLIESLLHPLELELQKTEHTYCGRIHQLFTKQLTKSIDDFYTRQSNGSCKFSTGGVLKHGGISPKLHRRHLVNDLHATGTVVTKKTIGNMLRCDGMKKCTFARSCSRKHMYRPI
ncbi:glucoside xylosyltransferase 1 isoform X2 [Hyla sarda]|uniref:glucoside xylosyltransferase 1 isoform X2 n=1 Tax=Hyla sarda TaxID=327740 RepID=UPI0024C2A365|nr:glucoside xylosyltransferase 1 isoform X2 [Hyla sarda]